MNRLTTTGAYKYVSELWRKKQSDVMRFCRGLGVGSIAISLPLFVLFVPLVLTRLVVSATRPNRDLLSPVLVSDVVVARGQCQRERADRKLGGLRVVNSYWLNEDSTYKYYEIILVDCTQCCPK
ncbi:unnamed protein product [Arabidopsis thaliana]|uniref:Ribosomal protein L15 n=1 Tax=Arabidopsis thaliana TaxID=3702 RepID=A0A7G2E730_ARATH|nr:unnamed protein product [Arabidopsis thaliana]